MNATVYINNLPDDADDCLYAQHIEFQRYGAHTVTDDVLAAVLARCPSLETVHLRGICDLTDRTVIRLATVAANLRNIDIAGCTDITDLAVLELAAQCTRLESVKLSGIPGLTDPAVSALARSLSRLAELELSNVPLLTAASLRDVWTFARKLRKLKVSRCTQLTDKAFPSVSSPSASPTWRAAGRDSGFDENLTYFSPADFTKHTLPHSPPPSRPPTWLDLLPPLLFPASHLLEDLRILDLSHCTRLTDAAVAGIIAHAPRLQNIALSGCSALTDRAVASIAALAANLDAFAFAHVPAVSDRALVQLARACPRLKSVDVDFGTRLTDLAVMELAGLARLRRLCVVHLTRLTDNALLFIAEHTPTLERLHLSQCRRISLDAIHTLLRSLPRLDHLSASGVPALRRIGVDRFSDLPPRDWDERRQGAFRVFRVDNILALRRFLDKEEARRREAEQRNIIFVPRADDSLDLY